MNARKKRKQKFRGRVTSVPGFGYVNKSQSSDSGSKLGSIVSAETLLVTMTGITSENVFAVVPVCSYVVQQ